MKYNLILDVDSYKMSHGGEEGQYPPKYTKSFGYIESRGGRYGSTVFFGLQAYIKEYLSAPVTRADVEEAAEFAAAHGEPFPQAGWMHIVEAHGGYLPVRIKAVAEGTVVPVGNILVSVESTDPQVPWIESWLETALLRAVWYPTTVATKSYYCKKVILEALVKSSDDPMGELPFKLHDFGARGVSSRESSGLGGMAHLVNFMGSDTIEGIRYANHFYGEKMAGYSICASEHSTMTILGREGELDQMRRVIRQIKPGGLAACVSDSYNLFHAVEEYWGDILHEEVKASGGTLVIRPDSGDPSEVNLKILQILERKIGLRTNMKGYKVLPNYYRLIQGDGNDNEESIRTVLDTLLQHGYSASNIAFGMGGGLLTQVTRDTQKFAMKLSWAVVDGKEVDVYKDPATDHGKKSKRGRLDLVRRDGTLVTLPGDQPDSLLDPVFENGKILRDQTFADVRKNAENDLLGRGIYGNR
jgi:nicotinamide phosphoribosyltransferase